MVTPQVHLRCLRESLHSLRFLGIMNRFGMFFLHDLNLQTNHLEEIDHQDVPEIMVLQGHHKRNPQASKKKMDARQFRLWDDDPEEDFPWGKTPSWQRIQDLVATECHDFLRPWKFTFEQEDEDHIYKKLFKVFTRDMWLSLGNHVIESTRLPNPRTLKEAMCTWTTKKIEQILGKDSCHFLPSTYGLVGRYPKNVQSQSFAEMRNIFFPSLDIAIPKRSLWHAYTDDGAYIALYHNYLRSLPDDEIVTLHNHLDRVFADLQCLPPSKPPNARGTTIWSATGGKIRFVTNSLFYRIEGVAGKDQRKAAGGPTRPQTSFKQLQTRIQRAHGGFQMLESRARQRTKSLKTRNYRKPPVNKRTSYQSHP